MESKREREARERAEKQALMRRMHAEGRSVNAIAQALGVASTTVSNWGKKMGLSFDRSGTRKMLKASVVDMAKLRAEIAEKLLAKADELVADMDAETLVFNFGGKDNTYSERTIPKPTTGDIKNLMISTGIALQRSQELTRFNEAESGQSDVDAWLGHMGGGQ